MTAPATVLAGRLGNRIFWISLAVTAAALVLTMAALTMQDHFSRREELARSTHTRALVIGESVAAALVFNDRLAAEEILGVLRVDAGVLAAAVYRGGRLFAAYHREGQAIADAIPATPPPAGTSKGDGTLQVVEKVRSGGADVGMVLLHADSRGLSSSLVRYGLVAIILLALALGGAYALLARMRRSVIVAEGHLDQLAHYDALTKLLNRNGFRPALELAIQRESRGGRKLALLFIDLDDFKIVNDSLGHEAGDDLLRAVAGRIKARLRASDTVARLGGDEFTVILEGLHDAAEADAVSRALLQELGSPFEIKAKQVFIGGSIGISLCPDDSRSADELLRNADTAMYRAKSAGKNGVAFFTPDMTRDQRRRFEIESGLRIALREGGFRLAYQPQVRLADGALVGAEALLRWDHPEFGPLGPAEYLKVAESSDLIEHIGDWVLREACLQGRRWRDEGLPPTVVAVNVSTRQLRRAGFVGSVRAVLEETGFDAAGLELEVTETALLVDPQSAIQRLHELRAMGVHLAIDDFGAGYSSMSYLHRMPIEKIKIDQSFLRSGGDSPPEMNIVKAVVAMASSMNKLALAEGVESEQVAEQLRAINCWAAQGYLFGRPGPAEDIAARLRLIGSATDTA